MLCEGSSRSPLQHLFKISQSDTTATTTKYSRSHSQIYKIKSNFYYFLILISLIQAKFSCIHSYELRLDQEKDRILWKFSGHYLYTQSGYDLEDLLNGGVGVESSSSTNNDNNNSNQLLLPQTELFINSTNHRNGIWFTKYIPRRQNTLVLTYTLKHALFTQGWISFFSTPNVQVKIKTNQDEEIATFWNDGKNWCDAVISMGLKTTISVQITTPTPKEYFLLDKIIMGIFSNVSQLTGKKLNPCLTSPLSQDDNNMNMNDDDLNKLDKEATTNSKSIRSTSTLSGQNTNFINDNFLFRRKVVKQIDSNSESTNNSNLEVFHQNMNNNNITVNETSSATNGENNIVNRQSRSSNILGVNSNQDLTLDLNLLNHTLKSESKENKDLSIEIPLNSQIIQTVRTLNESDENQNLICSCSCSVNKKSVS